MLNLKECLAPGELTFGVPAHYPAPGIVEEMAQGWDSVWIDGQHGQIGYRKICECVRTPQGMQLPVLVRLPSHHVLEKPD